jgi:hypothetical protein
MLISNPAQGLLRLNSTEYARLGQILDNFNLNLLIEFGMSLNRYKATGRVHALDSTAW